jgi:AcrR family transcriptional regulator
LPERRCGQIVCKASEVFAELGYQHTDVQVIAEALGISKGTIYRYFPSKQKLFLAAVAKGVDALREHTLVALDGPGDPLERMAASTRAYLEFFERYPRLVELFIQERVVFRDKRRPIYFEVGQTARAPWRALVQELIDSGRLRQMPVERVLNVMSDLVYGTMFTNYLSGRKESFQQQARDILDIVFNGILSGQEKKRNL